MGVGGKGVHISLNYFKILIALCCVIFTLNAVYANPLDQRELDADNEISIEEDKGRDLGAHFARVINADRIFGSAESTTAETIQQEDTTVEPRKGRTDLERMMNVVTSMVSFMGSMFQLSHLIPTY